MNETLSTKGRNPDESYIINMNEEAPLRRERSIRKQKKREMGEKDETAFANPIEKCLKNRGSRVVLYQEPQNLPINSQLTVLLYTYQHIVLLFAQRIFLCTLIILAFHGAIKSLVPITTFLFGFQILLIIKNFYFLVYHGKFNPEFRASYYLNAMYAFGLATLYAGACLFYSKEMDEKYLWVFAVPNVVLSTLRFFISQSYPKALCPMSLFNMIESLQILYIVIKLSYPDHYMSWESVFTFYFIIARVLGWIVVFFWIVAFVFILVICAIAGRGNMNTADLFTILIGCGLLYFIWNSYCFKYGSYGLFYLFEENSKILQGSPLIINYTLYVVAVIALTFSSISLLVMMCFYVKIKQIVQNTLELKKHPTVISLASFSDNLKMKIKQVSENYYQKNENGSGSNTNIDEENPAKVDKEQLCTVCYDQKSEVLIDPCGHSGFCPECITNCIKEKASCPICRQNIDKVYLICYDHATHSYMAKGVITFD
jgi:hypothetical protein